MSLLWPPKDPDEVLDFSLNWAQALTGSDEITSSLWTISGDDNALVQDSASNNDTSTTIWLSGGTSGEVYTLLNRVETQAGRTMDQSVSIRIQPK